MNFPITANGNSDEFRWAGGTVTMAVAGTLDGATVKLQANLGDAGFVDVGAAMTFTAPGLANFQLSPCVLRINTASGGASLDATAAIGETIVQPHL